jgi:glycosyltransferase involved in cell wall biosynthesis
MGLSVLILTKNEEKNIKRVIESVKDIADEIVVLDSGSTDRTVEI